MLHPSGLPKNLSSLDRTLVMGVLNVTPDSFSDGGRFFDASQAIAHAKQMIKDGADIIDIGGCSSKPGSKKLIIDDEIKRVIPTIELIKSKFNEAIISVDTFRSEVAKKAVNSCASIVNDISAG